MLHDRKVFADRLVVITGATGTLGKTLVEMFAASGASIAIHTAHKLDEAVSLAASIRASDGGVGGRAEVFTADLTRPESVPDLFDQISGTMGELDILINNAGVFTESLQQDLRLEQWNLVNDLNYRATFLCTREFLRRRDPARGSGSAIVNIASIHGLHPGFGGTAHYDASKGAVIAYTRSVAAEVGHLGIRVNAVAPGLIRTEQLEREAPELVGRYCQRAPLGRLIEPRAVGDAVLFLASPYADSITGEVITVDGGYVLS